MFQASISITFPRGGAQNWLFNSTNRSLKQNTQRPRIVRLAEGHACAVTPTYLPSHEQCKQGTRERTTRKAQAYSSYTTGTKAKEESSIKCTFIIGPLKLICPVS